MLGFLGGTGPLGTGLAGRLADAGHDVLLGSRTADRAVEVAAGLGDRVTGVVNADACDADVVFVTVPYEAQRSTLEPLAASLAGRIVVCTVVPMTFDARGPAPAVVAEGSAAEQVATIVGGARVVAGFQWVPASALKPGAAAEVLDVPLTGDDEEALAVVAAMTDQVPGLRAVVAGPLRLSHSVEALTPLLVAINKRHRAHASVSLTGLPPRGHG